METKILISGYYGMANAGDELILDALTRSVRSRLPGARITVLSGSPAQTARSFDVRAVSRKNLFAVIRAIADNTVIITGGGGVYQDITGYVSFYYYAAIALLAAVLRKQHVIWAVEITPLRNVFHRFIMRLVCKASRLISVRNQESKDLFESYGCSPPVYVVGDPVLTAQAHRHIGTEAQRKRSTANKIGIIVRKTSLANQPHIISVFTEFIDQSRQRGIETIIIPFHLMQDRDICKQIGKQTQTSVDVWQSVEGLVAQFSSLSLVISGRLHGLILAAALHIPCIGIEPDNQEDGGKVRNFMAFAGNPHCIAESAVTADFLESARGSQSPSDIAPQKIAVFLKEEESFFTAFAKFIG
jgi:polysaccharide pyruvyl transferase CsaB